MTEFEKQTQDSIALIESALERTVSRCDCLQKPVIEAMRYSLLGGGKRIRAMLVLELCRAAGGSVEDAVPFACAVEMIHAYSLIHDDLPCMDDDDLRRGKPSCHIAFGEANALLAGDGLLTLAFQTAAEHPNAQKLGVETLVCAVSELAKAAGVYGMIGGQVIDLESEGKEISLETLNHLYTLKTGALIRVSARLGCLAGRAGKQMMEAADEYAKKIGLAFQIIDDILDSIGDEKMLGKRIGSDVNNGKATYLSFQTVAQAQSCAEALIEEAKSALESGKVHSPFLCELAQKIVVRNY